MRNNGLIFVSITTILTVLRIIKNLAENSLPNTIVAKDHDPTGKVNPHQPMLKGTLFTWRIIPIA